MQQEPEVKMAAFMHPGFAVSIDEVESTANIAQPYVGIITDLTTGEIIHTAYGDYMMRLIGLLKRWLYQHLMDDTQQRRNRLRYSDR